MIKNKKPRLALILGINDWFLNYSPAQVARSQIRILVNNGYSVRVLLRRGCPQGDYRGKVDYRCCLPFSTLDPQNLLNGKLPLSKVRAIEKTLLNNLQGIDIVFTHDLLYLPAYMLENIAIRSAAKKLKNIRWLHWCHSGPYSGDKKREYPYNLLWAAMPGSRFICVNKVYRKDFALMYSVARKKIAAVYNPRSLPDFLGNDRLTRSIIIKSGLLEAEVAAIMPLALSRAAKQIEIALYLMAALKEQGKKVRLVFASPLESKTGYFYVARLKWLAEKIGLSEEEVVFSFELEPSLRQGCPEAVVRGLFQVSNLFIHPSSYEACSLTLLEAALTKNLCVLNADVPGFKELAGTNAIWIKCGNLMQEIARRYPSRSSSYECFYNYYLYRKNYYRSCALKIIRELSRCKPLALFTKIKNEFNDQVIFEKQLKPLLGP